MADTMRAWQFQVSSGPMEKNLHIPPSGLPIPPIKDDEVLVENYATGLNAIDYKILELGLITRLVFPSVTPGLEIYGRVAKIGSIAACGKDNGTIEAVALAVVFIGNTRYTVVIFI